MNLIEALKTIKDKRRKEGKRYDLLHVLLIVIMSVISGKQRYREIARYANANKSDFVKFFKLKRKEMPSFVTFREIIKSINFDEVIECFHNWTSEYVTIEKGEWLSIDGKSLKSTVSDYSDEYQNFVSLVSIFTHKKGQVLNVSKFENKKTGEIPTVAQLIEILELKDVIFTLDALHCQKKL